MIKRITLSALICAALIFTAVAADISEITEKWSELKPSFFEAEPYIEKPNDGEIKTAGKLNPEFINDGLNYLNFCRFVAGLPELEYIDTKNEDMQKAALLYSYAVYSDEETVPAGLSEEFYNSVYDVYNDSFRAFGFDTLDLSISGMINSRGVGSRYVPQRAALFMPHSGGISFGYYNGYVTAYVEPAADDFMYDFISWPTNGNFPLELMKDNLPWSVKLNNEYYSLSENSEFTVILENVSSGKSITITSENTYSFFEGSAAFLDIDNANNTIIFKPSHNDIASWIKDGAEIRVKIFGISTADGEETSLQYVVRLFDMNETFLEKYTDSDTIAAHQRDSVADLTASGVFGGYPDNTFRPHDSITRAEFTASLLRYLNVEPSVNPEAPFGDVSQEHWARGYIDKAFEIGAVNGTDPGVFSPEEPITVEQAMKIVTVVKGYTSKALIEESGGYPYAYFNLGYELGLLDNVEEEDLERELTRADTACIFYNASDITKYWIEKYYDKSIIWHRDRAGNGYGYYSLVKFLN